MAKETNKGAANKGTNKGGAEKAKSSPVAAAAPVSAAQVPADPDPVTPGKEGTESRSQLGKLISVPLSQVDAESFENQRTGDFTKGQSKEDGSDQSFDELFESIEKVGQKDPVTGRMKPAGQVTNGKPIELVKGFRRYAALKLKHQRDLAADPNAAEPTINIIIKSLTDLEALEENVFENTARDNLSGPDLAWAAYNLQERYKADGIAISDNILAKKMGKNQSYISKLKTIVQNAPECARAWRESAAPLTVEAMKNIAKLPREEQVAEYERINAVLAGKSSGGTTPPVETAGKQAVKLAKLLGGLAGQGLIKSDIDWTSDLEYIGVKTGNLTPQDKRAVGKLALAAFQNAAQPKTPKEAAAAVSEAAADATSGPAAAN